MSDISLSFTPLELVSFFAALAFLALALPVAVFCAIVFGFPGVRAARGWRRAAVASIVVLVALGTFGAPMLAVRANMWLQPFRDSANTVVLRESRTRDGIAYPAGTTLFLDGERGRVVRGALSAPGTVMHLPLEGEFSLFDLAGGSRYVGRGTLTAPARIGPMPCGRGSFAHDGTRVGCTLGPDTTVGGYPLAGGAPVEVDGTASGPALVAGTLGAPLVLYGVRWPAGTIAQPCCGLSADRLRDEHGPPNTSAQFCVPHGRSAQVGRYLVRGAMMVSYTDRLSDITGCPETANAGPSGDVVAGGRRYSSVWTSSTGGGIVLETFPPH
jgi:hypothetical protein